MSPPLRSVVALVFLALLVTTAGCGALESTDDREPYGVDDTVDPDQGPALTEDGIGDRIELRNAHVQGLLNESYRQTVRETTRNDSGIVPERTSEATFHVADGGAPALLERGLANATADADSLTVETWIDGGTAYVRYANDSEAVMYDSEARRAHEPTMPISLIEVYDAVDTVEPTDDGYRLEGTADSLGWYENATVTVTLTPEGIVETYHVAGTYVDGVERYDGELIVEIERIEVDLEEPLWLEEAKNEVGSKR